MYMVYMEIYFKTYFMDYLTIFYGSNSDGGFFDFDLDRGMEIWYVIDF